jgi:hypothetical protein
MFKNIFKILIIFLLINLITIPIVLSNSNYNQNNSEGLFGFRDFFAAIPIIDLEYEQQNENIIPNAGVLDIILEVSFRLGGSFRKVQEKLLKMPIQIRLSIEDTPKWCDASIVNPTVSIPVDETEPSESRLTLTVTEQAPAFHQGTIKIKATSEKVQGLYFTRLKEGEFNFDVSFEVGYWPVVSYTPEKGNLIKIQPSETANFPIIIQNLGNGETKVDIEVIEKPEEKWSVNIPSSVILNSPALGEENTRKTVNLIIKPSSSDNNIVNQRESFRLKFTPHYLGDPSFKGLPTTIIFTVEVKNDNNTESQEGIGLIIGITVAVIILIIVLIIFSVLYKNKKSQ